ncbi:MAG: hypothetical protein A2Y03_09700 [Omnitrophica WOR_2 bacterium GWF2_38_59]|nr:MAG: hypothetical protein A2Y03_09700 [Omnitrophica WOR_2 bacterium GWF2_38_59]OGX47542.1 MAG: hypothetical protein A2243_04555 [Omnitrophica WOR_2 bacterium RIFOXYA2_FULL_38_17]OGX58655.1 MAG: hypothetical protein A2306_10395 [Omnitrophica WOR_2 bacterium RIFOXYB2_FULL_38_16]HBG61917.1 hypothetical protein [Candidatus Omnitrophota bacterium]
MKKPLISIILPTYNGEKYVEEALNSIFNQSFSDYEIIVIDNGSKDSTLEILSKYTKKITILKESQPGVSFARNKGIKASKGKYIAFIDQDDIWHRDKLLEQKQLLASDLGVGMVGSGYDVINSYGKIIDIIKKKNQNKENFIQELFVRNLIGPPACMMIKKECFDSVGCFDTELNGVEDKDLWIRILEKYDIKYFENSLIKYRVHDDNAHKNVIFMKKSQKKFLMKHLKKINFKNINKAFGYVYLDGAREYFAASCKLQAFVELIKAIFVCPWPIYSKDDKWKLFVKIFLPTGLIENLKKLKKS